MKTAAEIIPTRYIDDGRSRRPEPRFRQRWSRLRKLQWHASLVMAEHPGVRLYVSKGRSWTRGQFDYGLYSISYNNGGMSPMRYDEAWTMLNGIRTGLAIAERLVDRS